MDYKESLERSENFAKEIIKLAASHELTVCELYKAADIAKGIADHSMVDKESIEKVDYPSRHITPDCEGKELFGD